MRLCFHCKKSLPEVDMVGRTDTCPFCDADLHCCMNCRFYDKAVYNECIESQAERVLEKEKSNFCDFFSYKNVSDNTCLSEKSSPKKHNPLDALFKK